MPDVFISYSRKDSEFVRALHSSLADAGRDAWVDWQDIAPSADWMAEIRGAIEQTDAFIFVLSPDSVASSVCGDELDYAVQQQKRLIPVVRRDVDASAVPEALRQLNWIFFRPTD